MIPFNKPVLKKDTIFKMRKFFLNSNSITEFEKSFSNYINRKYALFTSSGRNAIYLIFKSLKLKGEVLVSPLTCTNAIMPIVCTGLKPYFVDIDDKTFNMDPEKINNAINRKTCAIQIIHIGGSPCDINPIIELAEEHGLYIIEDCAQALGAEYQHKKVGSFGHAAVFSLPKSIYGIGGMITSNNRGLISKSSEMQMNFTKMPYNYVIYRMLRMMLETQQNYIGDFLFQSLMKLRELNPQARKILKNRNNCEGLENFLFSPQKIAGDLSFSQFLNINELINKRIEKAKKLRLLLKNNPYVETQRYPKGSKHAYCRFMITTPIKTKVLNQALKRNNLETYHLNQRLNSFYEESFDKHPIYSNFHSIYKCTNYKRIHDLIVTLPISPVISSEEISFVVETLENTLSKLIKS